MTYRRRHRWLRRLAFGLAFAAFASPAAAKFDEGGNGNRYVTAGGWSGLVDPDTGVPLSAGIGAELAFSAPMIVGEDVKSKASVAQAATDPYLTDVFVRQGESLGGPDGAAQAGSAAQVFIPGVTDFPKPIAVAVAGEPASSGRSVEWDAGLSLAIGGIVLALALGLGLGYLRRPRLAGL
ncbi:MAG TPA: hypothetical protein VM184_07595 [Gaiellaceae bacterium]|nr:hypothetical protein [Gaiellaceae bacterium]